MIDMQSLQYQKLVPHQVEYHAIYSGTHYYRTTHYRKLFILVLSTYLLVMGFLTVAVDNTVQNQNQHVASKTFLSCFPFIHLVATSATQCMCYPTLVNVNLKVSHLAKYADIAFI